MGSLVDHNFLNNQELIRKISSCDILESTMRTKTFESLPEKSPTETIEGDEKLAQYKPVARSTSRLCCCWMLAVDFGCHGSDGYGICCMTHGSRGGGKPTSHPPAPLSDMGNAIRRLSGGLKKPYGTLLSTRCEESRDQAGEEIH